MRRTLCLGLTAITLASVALPALAATIYSNEALFIAAAGSSKASLPSTLGTTSSFSATPFTFSADAGQTFIINTPAFGQAIPDENNLLLSGYESQTLASTLPLYAFGFKMFQPSNAAQNSGPNSAFCNATCDRGTFTITLFSDVTLVDSFTFMPTYDTIEFRGYAGTTSFNRILINDDLMSTDNEYFSTYRYSNQPVPELPTLAMAASGMALMLVAIRRKRQVPS